MHWTLPIDSAGGMGSRFNITLNHSSDGEFCSIRSEGADGNAGQVIIESRDLVPLIAHLAQLATDIEKMRGSQNIPYFPAHGIAVHQEPGEPHVLMTFRVDPDFAVTFGVDQSFLKDVLSELQPFLEAGSNRPKPKRNRKKH